MNAKKKYILLITISGIIFYILNHFTPLYSDDWHYNFIYGTFENINSLSDIIKSQYIHYFNVNGRFISHTIIQQLFFMDEWSLQLFMGSRYFTTI